MVQNCSKSIVRVGRYRWLVRPVLEEFQNETAFFWEALIPKIGKTVHLQAYQTHGSGNIQKFSLINVFIILVSNRHITKERIVLI